MWDVGPPGTVAEENGNHQHGKGFGWAFIEKESLHNREFR